MSINMEKTDYPFTLESQPDYGILNVKIPQGKTLKVEASAMAWMDSSLTMKAKMKGGLKRMLSGENLVISEFTAGTVDAEMGIAPGSPGEIGHVYLEDSTIFIQNSAYLASSPDLEVAIEFQGFKGFFSGEKMFMIKCSGTGDLWFNTFGGLIEIEVQSDYVVDTGYILGFTEGLRYEVRPVAGMKSLFFSGEGLVCRFTGEGRVWIQTRLAPAFVHWADPYRRVNKKSKD
ncbi:TIGR00266 family protein [Oceanispirochaeta sp.]|jgi:uncharacterized protein (TIGR00266 family)|uniref:TIGR00266 family protein n=1 Tax=Oceanispirochaeta sp. TaxID=2035350 RepID=UPI0026233F71|nr:TIGR00266 family protein [Oceanispirochaeta sp.]MDA3955576.1 TIGR00266 family protein [Oceanispirochaeta sp.]